MAKESVMDEGNKDQPGPKSPESILARITKHPLVRSVLGVLAVTTPLPNATHAQADVNKETAAAFSSGRPSIGYHLEDGMPSQRPILSPEISASLSFTETVKLLQVDRATIEQEWAKEGFNHYEVVDTVFVKNPAGDVSQILTLTSKTDPTSPYGAEIGLVSESHLDPVTNQFTEYKASTSLKLPIQNPGAIAVSSDGSFGLVGGEDPIRGNAAKLVAFFDGWKTPQEIEWPKEFGAVGGIIDILPLTGTNSFLINLGNFEGGISMYIVDVDPVAKKVTVRATNISGSAHGLSISSVDTTTKDFIGVAGGSYTLRGGVVVYNGNSETGAVTANHIDKAIMNGQEVNLPYLSGVAIYKDKNGNDYILASDVDKHYLYNINSKTKEATRVYYANWFDQRGIANYLPHSFETGVLRPLVDTEGNVHVWFGGIYWTTVEGFGRAVAGHFILGTDPLQNPDALTPYYLSPNQRSGVGNMKVEKIAGQPVLDMTMIGLGKSMILLNPDWSPAQGGTIYYLMKGLGAEATVYRVYTPIVSKGYSKGW